MGPGPSDVHPRVLAALGTPLVGHLDPEFVALMDETQDLLRYVFQTKNRLTLAISGTGSAGMETVVVNLIEPGDRMLVCINGVFGGRMKDVAERAGAEVTAIERPYGEVFDPDEVKAAIHRVGPKVVGIVHAETSTGAWQPVEEIARIAHEAGALIALDTVTALAGVPVEIDRLGDRRGLFRDAEVPELSARPGAGVVRPAGRRGAEPPQDEGPELVSRPDDDPALLGKRPVLSPHGADQHELRACARRWPWSSRRDWKPGSPGTRSNGRAPPRRAGRDGPEPGDRPEAPAAAVDLRQDPRRASTT